MAHLPLERVKNDYPDDALLSMRRSLAKTWRQNVNQVTDWEARFYLDVGRELEELTVTRL